MTRHLPSTAEEISVSISKLTARLDLQQLCLKQLTVFLDRAGGGAIELGNHPWHKAVWSEMERLGYAKVSHFACSASVSITESGRQFAAMASYSLH